MEIAKFAKSFTQQEPLPARSMSDAETVLTSGRLHRYGASAGEPSAASQLEKTYAEWQGVRFCLAVASGGQALQIALRSMGAGNADRVLTNAFTLAPVPGAIAAVGAETVLVESTEDLIIDLNDLDQKARASNARFLLLSHMRGHMADMDQITALCAARRLKLIEDCAHTMGAKFNGIRSGNHGAMSCFSTQTYKHINSGEGGLITTADSELAARATVLSGSYMNYGRHGAGPENEAFEELRLETPNMSARMDNLRASLLIPQIEFIDENVARWNRRHAVLEKALKNVEGVAVARQLEQSLRVGSSFQFRVPNADTSICQQIVAEAAKLGVELKWFGAGRPHGFTSTHKSWRYLNAQELPKTDKILSTLFDMRVPLSFSVADCRQIGEILQYVLTNLGGAHRQGAIEFPENMPGSD